MPLGLSHSYRCLLSVGSLVLISHVHLLSHVHHVQATATVWVSGGRAGSTAAIQHAAPHDLLVIQLAGGKEWELCIPINQMVLPVVETNHDENGGGGGDGRMSEVEVAGLHDIFLRSQRPAWTVRERGIADVSSSCLVYLCYDGDVRMQHVAVAVRCDLTNGRTPRGWVATCANFKLCRLQTFTFK
jgi:hypothetical protein